MERSGPQTGPQMNSSNELLPPRYRDPTRIGYGGMGEIFRAEDSELGRVVAIKVLAERYARDPSLRQRFTREALAAARLSGDPRTVTIFDVGEWEGRPFIVMEHLDGGSLEDRLRSSPPSTDEALDWLTQAAAALDAAHAKGVVHRDVKPGNLLLADDGSLRVADFGIASAAGLQSLTMTGTVLGTAGYLSPEQAQGERATPASDRYALAVVAYELLTGGRPFESESPTAEATAHVQAEVPSVSPQLDPVFRRAMAKDPEERYPSAAAFVEALREALEGGATTTRVLPVAGRRSPWLLIAGLVLAALLGGAGLAALSGRPGRRFHRSADDRSGHVRAAAAATPATASSSAAPAPTTATAAPATAAASSSACSKRHRADRSSDATARARQLRGRGPAGGSSAPVARRNRPALRGICGVRPRSRSRRARPLRPGAAAPRPLRAAAGASQGDRPRTEGVQARPG